MTSTMTETNEIQCEEWPPDPGVGWRLLSPGESVEADDEIRTRKGDWHTMQLSVGMPKCRDDEFQIRRKIVEPPKSTARPNVRSMSMGELAAEIEKNILARKRVTAEESELKLYQSELENQFLELMGEAGCQNWKTTGGMTLYRRTDRFPSVAEGYTKEELVKELGRHPETMDLVSPNYNANSLRSRLKEIDENGEALPAELAKMIKIIEKDKVGHK